MSVAKINTTSKIADIETPDGAARPGHLVAPAISEFNSFETDASHHRFGTSA
jgi:hypothetical protein